MLAGRLGITGEKFDLYPLSEPTFSEVRVEHPLRLVRRRRTTIRPEWHADHDSASIEGLKLFTQPNRAIDFPWMNGTLGESRDEIRPHLHTKRDDQVIVVEFSILQLYLPVLWIDAQNFGLHEFDVALRQ